MIAVTLVCLNQLSSAVVFSAQLLPNPRVPVVVSMGDSYASGNGAGYYVGVGECYRSFIAWGAQFSKWIRTTSIYLNRGFSAGKFTDILNDRPSKCQQRK